MNHTELIERLRRYYRVGPEISDDDLLLATKGLCGRSIVEMGMNIERVVKAYKDSIPTVEQASEAFRRFNQAVRRLDMKKKVDLTKEDNPCFKCKKFKGLHAGTNPKVAEPHCDGECEETDEKE